MRELMVIPTYDWGKSWQGDFFSVRDAYRITDNLYLYAAGHTVFSQGNAYMVHADSNNTPDTIKLARLDYASNADPEPSGWRRAAALLHNNDKINLDVQSVKLGAGKLTPANFKLAHITGTTRVTLTDDQQKEIKNYVQAGGVLLIDAAGGSKEFAASMEKELLAIFPEDALQLGTPIPVDDPILKADSPIDYRYRRYLRAGEHRPKGPELYGMKIKDHWAVLLSRQDISNGLVGRDVDGVTGYTPQCATALAINILKQFGK